MMIQGVQLIPLKILKDDRGSVMHMMRKTDPYFSQFGEIYFSTVKTGVIKAWKKHTLMTQNFSVPLGKIKIVIFDDRENSSTKNQTQEIILGTDSYQLAIIPPGVWYGFTGLEHPDAAFSMIANMASIPHDPTEVIRKELDDPLFKYAWGAP